VVHDLIAAWNARDIDRFLGFLTDDVEWDDPAMSAPARGKEAVRTFAQAVLTAFPDFSLTLRGPVCVAPDGGSCAVPWRITGTHLRPLAPGYTPTRRTAAFDGVDHMEFRGGRIARIGTFFDVRAAAGQLLGVSLRPRPGSRGEWALVTVQRLAAAFVRLAGRRSTGR
jgi:steroid delta-isomerase-like uncharacterized protein